MKNEDNIILTQSIDIHDYRTILEGLIDDFGYIYYHAILAWCRIIDDNDDNFWQVYLIRKDFKIIGFCGLYSLVDRDISELWLGWFGILKEYRNNGIGSTVLNELENKAKYFGAKKLYTYVDELGKPLSFYYKNGFERICDVFEYTTKTGIDINQFESPTDHVLVKEL